MKDCRPVGGGQLVRIYTEFLLSMEFKSLLRMSGNLFSDPPGQTRFHPAPDERGGEFLPLVDGMFGERLCLDRSLGSHQFVLGLNGGVFPRRHRKCPGNEAGQTRKNHRMSYGSAASYSGNQRDVRHESVHRSEYRRSKATARNVSVVRFSRWFLGLRVLGG